MSFRTLRADEIEVRVAQAKKNGAQLLLYKDARCDMNILDETIGPANWQRRHAEHNGNLFCAVGICFGDKWVWKEDAGAESNTEAEKGHASDSFKRACVNWGIGRELYTSPLIWVNGCTEQNDKGKYICKVNFRVSSIAYDDRRRINALTIVDGTGKIVYQMGKSQVTDTKFRCADCGKEIYIYNDDNGKPVSLRKQDEGTRRRFGRPLCHECVNKALLAEVLENADKDRAV